MKPVEEQLAIISRGVAQIEPLAELRHKLTQSVQTGKPLRVKYGIDPTGIDVHLGHTVPLRKLRQFQDLGHQAVLILGNYTALVGDPSGRDETRKGLTPEQIAANARDYLTQIGRIIDLDRTEVHSNGDWFSRFSFLDVLALTSKMTMQRMLERDDFTRRRERGVPIYLHECLYPLMQAHDSVVVRADVELGGTEQLFNLMLGRQLQQDAGQPPQVCLTMPILRGTDGERKMGKSLGNYIGVGMPPEQMFGLTMSIPDSLLPEWFALLTDRPAEETDPLIAREPMAAKKLLGRDIVATYHGQAVAAEAETNWVRRFSERQDPDDIEEVVLSVSELTDGAMWICKLLVRLGLAASNSEARRLLGPTSGVTVGPDRQKITDEKANVPISDGLVVRVGSRRIKRVRLA
jgi:tyrosyl-tRNA synthetase